jgi:hypothetical protein
VPSNRKSVSAVNNTAGSPLDSGEKNVSDSRFSPDKHARTRSRIAVERAGNRGKADSEGSTSLELTGRKKDDTPPAESCVARYPAYEKVRIAMALAFIEAKIELMVWIR